MNARPPVARRSFLGRLMAAAAGLAWLGRARTAGSAPDGTDQPYIGEIRMFAGDFAPAGWLFCDGQLVLISDNDALFSLIGTTYGGDGQTTFALPDLRGRAPVHAGTGFILGQVAGAETVTLTVNQITNHTHIPGASAAIGSAVDPTGGVPAVDAAGTPRYGTVADTDLAPGALLPTGGSQPHDNMQPSLAIHFIISSYGVYPSQS